MTDPTDPTDPIAPDPAAALSPAGLATPQGPLSTSYPPPPSPGRPMPHFPPDWLRERAVVARRQWRGLHDAIAPFAGRHAQLPAPASVVADVAALLGLIRPLVARLPGWRGRTDLAAAPSWAALSVKLALAGQALGWFEHLYIDPPDSDFDEDEEEEADPPWP